MQIISGVLAKADGVTRIHLALNVKNVIGDDVWLK